MRCPNCLYNNHEQADVCERCGEPLHGENRLFNTCPNCGYINEAGAEFCESCGESMMPGGKRKATIRKKKAKRKRERNARAARSGEGCSSWLFLMILIFIALVLLGLIHQADVLTPAEVSEPETLLVLQGTDDLALSESNGLDNFSALAIDAGGVVRMALYVDGQLTSAQSYGPSNQATFIPDLGALPPGEHDIFIRSVNAEGQAAYSQIIRVTKEGGASGSFGLAADSAGLPVPEGLRANSITDGQRISISWDEPEAAVGGMRIYTRPPGSSGLVHLADLDGTADQYDFPAERMGEWEIYVAYLSADGYEGSPGFTSLHLGDAENEQNPMTVELPRPTKVRLATNLADCQQAASQLGSVRDVYHSACVSEVEQGQHNFLVWRWPLKWQDGRLLTDNDILGFELKLTLINAEGTVLGERISAIPFSHIRGVFRTSAEVNCDVQRSWTIRAVGMSSASDWAYAGSSAATSCDPAAPATDGCVGQADGVAMSNLPEGFMPDLFFGKACEGLDQCYADGTLGQPKVDCDNLFHTNLLALCSHSENEWGLASCQKMAEAYYRAANLYGAAYYPQEPSFEKCLEADNVGGCFRGNLPETLRQGDGQGRAGVIWVGKAAGTGVDRFINGVLWAVDWVIGAVDSILP